MVWEWDYGWSGNELQVVREWDYGWLGTRLQVVWEWANWWWPCLLQISWMSEVEVSTKKWHHRWALLDVMVIPDGKCYWMFVSLAPAPAPEECRGSPAKKRRLDSQESTGDELFQAGVVVSCVRCTIQCISDFKTLDLYPLTQTSFLFWDSGTRQSGRFPLLLKTLFFVWSEDALLLTTGFVFYYRETTLL